MSKMGIPRELISDQGLHFKSNTCSSPIYAQSNGAVERAVRTVKIILKKAMENNEDPDLAILAWQGTPLDENTKSLAEMLLGRKVMINLPVKAELIPKESREARAVNQKKIC